MRTPTDQSHYNQTNFSRSDDRFKAVNRYEALGAVQ
jgi:hypothetical protein